LFGDYFNPAKQSYHLYPFSKNSVFRRFAPEAFFLMLNSKYMQRKNTITTKDKLKKRREESLWDQGINKPRVAGISFQQCFSVLVIIVYHCTDCD